MSADAGGNPYIATYWRSSDSEVPQYRIVWNDGKTWHNRQVTDRKTPFTLKGGGTKMIPVARPRIVVEDGEIFYISVTKSGAAVSQWRILLMLPTVSG